MTSNEIAEQLARKCARPIAIDCFNRSVVSPDHTTAIAQTILQSIPLVELLELYKTTNNSICRHEATVECKTCIVISNLTTKLKQLGIDV